MCVCKCEKRNASFIATWHSLAHFRKSISAPAGNLHGTIYEAGSSISTRLLGPSETKEADTNAGEQTRPASPRVRGKRFPVYFMSLAQTFISPKRRAKASGGRQRRSARPRPEPVFTILFNIQDLWLPSNTTLWQQVDGFLPAQECYQTLLKSANEDCAFCIEATLKWHWI